ncbi:MAG TPA: DUF4256 domain-containing protein [Opitutaceae bacterium]|nr:DUF4256 domain-containing protein [Opitutaceae bacterium]
MIWLPSPCPAGWIGDRRFGCVFFYHNGAESYYSGRGFRGSLRV